MGSTRVVVAAFGDPRSPRTFSGYPSSLTRALEEADALAGTVSFRPSLAVLLRQTAIELGPGLRPRVSRRWLYSRRGAEVMGRLLAEVERGPAGPWLLQIGTEALPPIHVRPHAVFTDMTIPQARRAGAFTVMRLDDGRLDRAEALQREVLAGADAVLALSQWTADSLAGDCDVPAERISVIHAGPNVDVRLVDEAVERRPGRLLFVGIDWERKGGPTLVAAFEQVASRHPAARLVVVGASPPLEHPQVEVVGFLDRRVPDEDRLLRREYARASAFVLPSRFDPFPNVLVEAATAGLPAVAFDNGSRREVIVDGETGWLVPDGDVDALAATLDAVLSDHAAAVRAGAAARRRAEKWFTWQAVVDRVQAALR